MASNNDNSNPELSHMLHRLRRTAPDSQSHTHRRPYEIARDLHVGPIERFLLWLSKTDLYVMSLTPYHTRQTLASLGMMVLFTTTLAFLSSYYAAYSTLIGPKAPYAALTSLAIALVYAFGIMIIDREIVGSISKKSLFARLFFAVFIATAVSWPVKLKFFEGRVDAEITRMVEERNANKLKKIEELRENRENERQSQIKEINDRIASLKQRIAGFQEDANRERHDQDKGAYCGSRCQAFEQQAKELDEERKSAQAALEKLSARSLPPQIQAEIDSIQKEVDKEKDHHDFLTKWQALGRIKEQSGSQYAVISTFLIVFFMLLELIPMMLKWSIGKTEYHYYLESRTNLNNQKIISLTNLFIEAMQKNRLAVLEIMPLEITDLIAMHLEDEAQDTPPSTSNIQTLTDALRNIIDEKPEDTATQSAREEQKPPATTDPTSLPDNNEPDPNMTVDEPPPSQS